MGSPPLPWAACSKYLPSPAFAQPLCSPIEPCVFSTAESEESWAGHFLTPAHKRLFSSCETAVHLCTCESLDKVLPPLLVIPSFRKNFPGTWVLPFQKRRFPGIKEDRSRLSRVCEGEVLHIFSFSKQIVVHSMQECRQKEK